MNPMPSPPYEWDDDNRHRNIETHRIDFRLGYGVNHAAKHRCGDRRRELRYSSYVPIDDRLHHVVWTPRGPDTRTTT